MAAAIRTVSDLQRKVGELTRLAKETGEPVYLTKNGAEHMVLVDFDVFNEMQRRLERYERAGEGK